MGYIYAKPKRNGVETITGKLTILTCRRKPEPYDWVWWQSYYNNTKGFEDLEVTHLIREGIWEHQKELLQLSMYLNEAYVDARGTRTPPEIGENEYICKWTADVILKDDTLHNALYELKRKDVVGAGVGGFILGWYGDRPSDIVRIVAGEPCVGFLDWWVFKLKFWKHLEVPGDPIVESEVNHQHRLHEEGRKIVHLTDPYLHFNKNVKFVREGDDRDGAFRWDGKNWRVKYAT